MNTLSTWVQTPGAQAVGWALVHFLWEGVALGALLAAAVYLLPSSAARVRYAAACVTLFAMPVAFFVTLMVLLPGHQAPARTAFIAGPIAHGAIPIWHPSDSAPTPLNLAELLPWLAPCWFLGVLFFYGRGVAGWLAVRRLRRRGICEPVSACRRHLARLCQRMSISRPVQLLESCFADVPVLVGYLRPVILVPLGCLANLPAAQVECILIHELAHIRRHDYLVNLFQGFVEGLLFYHPAVWWASRVVREERENCCDDTVVAFTGDARVYAATLATLEHRRAVSLEMVVAATGGSLMKRIRRLLSTPQPAQRSATPAFAAGLLVVTFAAALAAWPASPTPQSAVPAVALRARLLALQALEPQASPLSSALQKLQNSEPDAAFRQWLNPHIKQKVRSEVSSQNGFALLSDASFFSPTSAPDAPSARQQAQSTEMPDPYRKWMNEDGAYIIKKEERAAFLRLQTDDEREQFIKQFWIRRDPTPGTPENEFREEHYRRIAYANEHFSSAIPGWKTDRGRIYITYGPPDQLEDHPADGTTFSVPYQRWRYRLIDGVGTNVVIEFADPTGKGEYHMTMDPVEKAAALGVLNSGQTTVEQMGSPDDGQANSPTLARAAKVFQSAQDSRVTVATGAVPVDPPPVKAANGLYIRKVFRFGQFNNALVVALGPAAGTYSISATVTTAGGVVVQVFSTGAPAPGPFFRWLTTLTPGSYVMQVLIKDPSGATKSSETPFTVD